MRAAAEISFTMPGDARRSPRFAADVPACFAGAQRIKVQAKVLDLSSQGCRLEFSGDIPQGAIVEIKVPGFNRWEARVVWSKRGSAGCEFVHALHPAVVQRLILRGSEEIDKDSR